MVPEWPAARRHSEPGRGIGRPSLRPRASLPDGRQYIKLRSGISSVLVSSECLEPSNAVVEANVQEWPATAALIIAEVIGSGVLALGGQTAVVGLVVGLLALLLFYPANVFTALLLGKVRQKLPAALTFGDALTMVLGPKAGRYGYMVLYFYLFMCMANYLIVLGHSVQASIYWTSTCQPWACFIGTILLLPLNQFRTLSGLTLLSMVSFATIVTTLALCLWTLLTNASCQPQQREPGFLDYNSCISGFVFAFAGQHIMLEMQAEMKNPEHFPNAVFLSYSVLFLVYTLVAVLSYLACGKDTPGDLLLVLPTGWWKSLAGALMVLHLMVTYTISQQVLNRAICVYLLPGALQDGLVARFKWFLVTSAVMAACYTLANAIPLFQDVVNLSGALLSTQCVFILPGVLFLALCSFELVQREGQVAVWIGSWSAILVGVYLIIMGTLSSIVVISAKLSSGSSRPFSC
ncbi:unnamed protein product [Durusdinium trenchii]|uniref:Uncharacterized protein n=2 Tax=Durusdinium trenchii TaxID=1381693 RepID=A0ABP0HCJ3_9DINO